MSNLREVIEELAAERRWHSNMSTQIENVIDRLDRLHGYSSPVYLRAKDLRIDATAEQIVAHIEYIAQTEDPEERIKEQKALDSILYLAQIYMLEKAVAQNMESLDDSQEQY